MEFEEALTELKAGKIVTNSNWNGRGMFLYAVPANEYPAQTDVARKEFGDMVGYGPYIAMKNAQGIVTPWLASQMDFFSDGWEVIE